MAVLLIADNDKRYLKWIRINHNGFVVNIRRKFDPDYVVLHRASCRTINSYPGMVKNPGGYTERSYWKVSGDSVLELSDYLKNHTDRSPPFSKLCSICNPAE